MFAKSLLIFTLGSCLKFSSGLKLVPEEYSAEERCPVVHPNQSLNMTWLTSLDHWYVHAITRQSMYDSLHLVTTEEEFASLTDEVVQKTCFMFTQFAPSPNTIKLYGMNRTFSELEVSFPKYRKGVVEWALTGPDPQHVATSYVILTDNKSYIAGIDIFDDGVKGLFVLSPSSSIPTDDMDRIKKLMGSHGFPKDAFYPLETDCEHDEFLNNIKKSLSLS